MKSLLILLHIVNKYGTYNPKQTNPKKKKKKRRKKERKKEEANFKRLHQFVTTNYILFHKVTLAQLLPLL